MPSIKILHCGDLHIGANEAVLGEKAENRKAEMLLTFEKIVDTAIENGVELVLIAGDFLHSNKVSKSLIDRIYDAVNRARGITFVYAAGNHDPLNFDSPFFKYEHPENFCVLPTNDGVVEVKEGVKVYGKSFAEIINKGEERFSLTPDQSDINIMCIHGEYGMDNGRNPITDGFIVSSGMDYIALGHIHKRTPVQALGNTRFAYCGCAEGQGFDETGEKGVYVGTVGKGECDLQFVPVNKRMHICEDIDVSNMYSSPEIYEHILKTLSEKYGSGLTDNLYKINLVGAVTEEADINITEISVRLNETVYFAKVEDKTTLTFDLDKFKNEMSLKGIFVKKMLERIEQQPENEEKLNKALKIGLQAFGKEEG